MLQRLKINTDMRRVKKKRRLGEIMEVILHAEGDNYRKLKERLLGDEVVNRASITFKDAKQFEKERGYFCIIKGDEERCAKALELAKDQETGEELAKELTGEEKEKVLKALEEEGDRANEGFGNMFG